MEYLRKDDNIQDDCRQTQVICFNISN